MNDIVVDVELVFDNNAVCVRQYLTTNPTHRLTFDKESGRLKSLEELMENCDERL